MQSKTVYKTYCRVRKSSCICRTISDKSCCLGRFEERSSSSSSRCSSGLLGNGVGLEDPADDDDKSHCGPVVSLEREGVVSLVHDPDIGELPEVAWGR